MLLFLVRAKFSVRFPGCSPPPFLINTWQLANDLSLAVAFFSTLVYAREFFVSRRRRYMIALADHMRVCVSVCVCMCVCV